jgi:hypothetical protein
MGRQEKRSAAVGCHGSSSPCACWCAQPGPPGQRVVMGQSARSCGSPSRGNRIKTARFKQGRSIKHHRFSHIDPVPARYRITQVPRPRRPQRHGTSDSPSILRCSASSFPLGRQPGLANHGQRVSIVRREPLESVSRLIVGARAPTARQDRLGGPWLGFQAQARIPPKQSPGAAQTDLRGGLSSA